MAKAEAVVVWMDVAAVAVFLGVSRDTVYAYANDGLIPGFQAKKGARWKFRRDQIERWLEKESRAGVKGNVRG